MDGHAGRLAGKVALITGAASGIGRATAALFHAEGAKVAATDRNEAGLKTLGADADLKLAQDVTDEARWREVVDEVLAAFGRLDILVNSAGIAILGNIETTTLADWRKVNAVNAEGAFLGCREAVRAMKETGGGSIVNLSSVAGIIGDAFVARLLREQGGGEALDQIRRASLRPRRLQNPRELRPSLVRRDADGARRHRAGEGPGPDPRRPRARRADGADGQGRGGRQHDPVSRERRILVHHRRGIHGRWRAYGAISRRREFLRRTSRAALWRTPVTQSREIHERCRLSRLAVRPKRGTTVSDLTLNTHPSMRETHAKR